MCNKSLCDWKLEDEVGRREGGEDLCGFLLDNPVKKTCILNFDVMRN